MFLRATAESSWKVYFDPPRNEWCAHEHAPHTRGDITAIITHKSRATAIAEQEWRFSVAKWESTEEGTTIVNVKHGIRTRCRARSPQVAAHRSEISAGGTIRIETTPNGKAVLSKVSGVPLLCEAPLEEFVKLVDKKKPLPDDLFADLLRVKKENPLQGRPMMLTATDGEEEVLAQDSAASLVAATVKAAMSEVLAVAHRSVVGDEEEGGRSEEGGQVDGDEIAKRDLEWELVKDEECQWGSLNDEEWQDVQFKIETLPVYEEGGVA